MDAPQLARLMTAKGFSVTVDGERWVTVEHVHSDAHNAEVSIRRHVALLAPGAQVVSVDTDRRGSRERTTVRLSVGGPRSEGVSA